MKVSAGTCSFEKYSKNCCIRLSEPLLKLRSRKDLVETLLHEMIHAYLFLYDDDRDRDGHGPKFKMWMNNINRLARTNISIYHDFHEEVRLFKNQWYRCNGPCSKLAPLFGYRKGVRNRGPCLENRWYSAHKKSCSGTFSKVANGPTKTGIKKEMNRSSDVQSLLTSSGGKLAAIPGQKKQNASSNNGRTQSIPHESSLIQPFTGTGFQLGSGLSSAAVNGAGSVYDGSTTKKGSKNKVASSVIKEPSKNVEPIYPIFKEKLPTQTKKNVTHSADTVTGSNDKNSIKSNTTDVTSDPIHDFSGDIQKAIALSLEQQNKIAINKDNEEDIQKAIALSLEQQNKRATNKDNEEDIQKAIALSLQQQNKIATNKDNEEDIQKAIALSLQPLSKENISSEISSNDEGSLVECPSCSKRFCTLDINGHLDRCLQ